MARKEKNIIVETEDGRKIILDVGDLAWVKAGKNRMAAIQFLADGHYTPRDVGRETGMGGNTASKVLRDFAERGIAECVNPDDKRGRLYRLTRKGKNLLENV